jgi:hypothetical protein
LPAQTRAPSACKRRALQPVTAPPVSRHHHARPGGMRRLCMRLLCVRWGGLAWLDGSRAVPAAAEMPRRRRGGC